MPNRVLMIAFHFPPIRHSSGIQRTLKFATYLRDYGWAPIVLTVKPIAYPEVGFDQLQEVPGDIPVYRAFALDAVRHFSIKGKYPFLLGNPDRWRSWVPFGVALGKRIIREHRPSAIWSTYPIPSAHVIGAALRKYGQLPWVADFRDQMTEPGYPPNPRRYEKYKNIEFKTITESSAAVFTTAGTRDLYADRYPHITDTQWHIIENGYDEENFRQATKSRERSRVQRQDGTHNPVLLVHAGILYPKERDPTLFFRAIKELKQESLISSARVRVILRATGHDDLYRPMLQREGIDDIVGLAPGIGYQQALTEMLEADGLLLFQAAGCNSQIPAKLYEYMRAQRPILALSDQHGETAKLIRTEKAGLLAPLDDTAKIKQSFMEFLISIEHGSALLPNEADVQRFSRQHGAESLAKILNSVTTKARYSHVSS